MVPTPEDGPRDSAGHPAAAAASAVAVVGQKLTSDSNNVLDLRHDSLHLLSRHCSDQAGRLETRAPLPYANTHTFFLLEPNILLSHPWRRWGLTVTSALAPS